MSNFDTVFIFIEKSTLLLKSVENLYEIRPSHESVWIEFSSIYMNHITIILSALIVYIRTIDISEYSYS